MDMVKRSVITVPSCFLIVCHPDCFGSQQIWQELIQDMMILGCLLLLNENMPSKPGVHLSTGEHTESL